MKITVGLKVFSVALVLMALVGAVAWINARSTQRVDALITSVNETYVPAYGALARSNLRAVEEGLFVRRLIIARLLTAEDDRALSDLKHGADERAEWSFSKLGTRNTKGRARPSIQRWWPGIPLPGRRSSRNSTKSVTCLMRNSS